MRSERYSVTVGDKTYTIAIVDGPHGPEVSCDGRRVEVDVRRLAGPRLWSVKIGDAIHRAFLEPRDGETVLTLDNRAVAVQVVTERERMIRSLAPASAARKTEEVISSPIPGLLTAVRVVKGDVVAAGQSVVTIEAMKMQNELKATIGGVVTRVHSGPGEAVPKGKALITIKLNS